MYEDLDYCLKILRDHGHHLQHEEREMLTRTLEGIIDLVFREELSGNSRTEILRQISNYIRSKAKRDSELSLDSNNISLLEYRNRRFHEMAQDPQNAKKLYLQFWRLLEKDSVNWHPYELANLLSYCLRTGPGLMDLNHAEPIKMVRVFKSIFNALSNDQKTETFDELMMRFSNEPRFRRAIEMERYSKP